MFHADTFVVPVPQKYADVAVGTYITNLLPDTSNILDEQIQWLNLKPQKVKHHFNGYIYKYKMLLRYNKLNDLRVVTINDTNVPLVSFLGMLIGKDVRVWLTVTPLSIDWFSNILNPCYEAQFAWVVTHVNSDSVVLSHTWLHKVSPIISEINTVMSGLLNGVLEISITHYHLQQNQSKYSADIATILSWHNCHAYNRDWHNALAQARKLCKPIFKVITLDWVKKMKLVTNFDGVGNVNYINYMSSPPPLTFELTTHDIYSEVQGELVYRHWRRINHTLIMSTASHYRATYDAKWNKIYDSTNSADLTITDVARLTPNRFVWMPLCSVLPDILRVRWMYPNWLTQNVANVTCMPNTGTVRYTPIDYNFVVNPFRDSEMRYFLERVNIRFNYDNEMFEIFNDTAEEFYKVIKWMLMWNNLYSEVDVLEDGRIYCAWFLLRFNVNPLTLNETYVHMGNGVIVLSEDVYSMQDYTDWLSNENTQEEVVPMNANNSPLEDAVNTLIRDFYIWNLRSYNSNYYAASELEWKSLLEMYAVWQNTDNYLRNSGAINSIATIVNQKLCRLGINTIEFIQDVFTTNQIRWLNEYEGDKLKCYLCYLSRHVSIPWFSPATIMEMFTRDRNVTVTYNINQDELIARASYSISGALRNGTWLWNTASSEAIADTIEAVAEFNRNNLTTFNTVWEMQPQAFVDVSSAAAPDDEVYEEEVESTNETVSWEDFTF